MHFVKEAKTIFPASSLILSRCQYFCGALQPRRWSQHNTELDSPAEAAHTEARSGHVVPTPTDFPP